MAKVVFHRVSGSKKKDVALEVDDNFISLHNRSEGALVFNFTAPEEESMKIYHFFDNLDDMESVPVNIDYTGAVEHYFRGISPIEDVTDQGLPLKKFSVTLQLRREIL